MQKSSHLQRKGWKLLAWMALLGLVNPGQAETKEELNRAAEARLKKDILFLASPECEGRGPTTDGLRKAGDYLADEFAKIGLKPGFKGSYFQPFTIAGAQGKIQLTRPQGPPLELKAKQDFLPLGTDQEGKAEGSLVFAGYGLTCKEPAYDDYADIDVKGKIVVLLRDTPRSTDKDRPREMVAGSSFTAKMTLAQKKGALAVLFLNDADSAKDGDPLMDYTYTSVTRGGKHLPAFVLKRAVFEQLLPPGKALPELETKIDKELKPQSFDIPNCKASVEALKKADGIALRNVVGIHEGSGNLAKEVVVIGAHYDHLGYGGPSSMARGKKPVIHHGADDNASGTTALLELARRFVGQGDRQGRTFVFVAFSGEELGLFGSRHYCNEPAIPLTTTSAMFNLDMVGRLRKDPKTDKYRLLTEGHGTAKEFKALLDTQSQKHGFTLQSKESGFGPSDHASFCGKKVPVLFFWTGNHEEYHKPTDTAERIEIEGMRRIVDMSEEVVTFLSRMDRPAFVEVKGAPTGRPSTGPRLGIRPGYNEGTGVEVEGVTDGGAAQKAGVKDGDIIVAIAGKSINDLNTYMQTMAVQKPGTVIELLVLRGKEKKKLSLKVQLDAAPAKP